MNGNSPCPAVGILPQLRKDADVVPEMNVVNALVRPVQFIDQRARRFDERIVADPDSARRGNMIRIFPFQASVGSAPFPLVARRADFEGRHAAAPHFPVCGGPAETVVDDVNRSRPRRPVKRLPRNSLKRIFKQIAGNHNVLSMVLQFDGIVDAACKTVVLYPDIDAGIPQPAQRIETVMDVIPAYDPVLPHFRADAGLIRNDRAAEGGFVRPGDLAVLPGFGRHQQLPDIVKDGEAVPFAVFQNDALRVADALDPAAPAPLKTAVAHGDVACHHGNGGPPGRFKINPVDDQMHGTGSGTEKKQIAGQGIRCGKTVARPVLRGRRRSHRHHMAVGIGIAVPAVGPEPDIKFSCAGIEGKSVPRTGKIHIASPDGERFELLRTFIGKQIHIVIKHARRLGKIIINLVKTDFRGSGPPCSAFLPDLPVCAGDNDRPRFFRAERQRPRGVSRPGKTHEFKVDSGKKRHNVSRTHSRHRPGNGAERGLAGAGGRITSGGRNEILRRGKCAAQENRASETE